MLAASALPCVGQGVIYTSRSAFNTAIAGLAGSRRDVNFEGALPLGGYRCETFDLLTLTNWNHDTAQGGDSGSPYFFTLDGELCLADILSGSLGSYPISPPDVRHEVTDPAYMQTSVNAAMRELSLRNGRTNIYSLTVLDLSKYPLYRQSHNCSP